MHPDLIDGQLSAYLAKLGRPWEAVDAARTAAGRFDPSLKGLYAHCQMRLATALVLCEEIDEAAHILGAAAGTASASPSPRLTADLHATRAQLQPWQDTHAITNLDAQLAACGVLEPIAGSGG